MSSSSILSVLPDDERKDLKLELDLFIGRHAATHHRPIALVSSGGTVADLERNSVRCLDNFSTGLRGSIAVEEFLRRGYAVVHLWRRGSCSPYARAVSQYLGLHHPNHALDVESLGRLFAVEGQDHDDELVRTVLRQERDPWLTRTSTAKPGRRGEAGAALSNGTDDEDLALNRGLLYSTQVNKAIRERSVVMREGRLMTVPFRSVEEYLAKLQICSESLQTCRSLAVFYLAAAVSDFYIPHEDRSEHKIQSQSNQDGLVIKLSPVPKTMGLLRQSWAPDAFVVSFKLETDMAVLRHKAERAVEKYGCHMVIGNLLHSRHEKVWILCPDDYRDKNPSSAKDWPKFAQVVKPNGGDPDSLEEAVMDHVVDAHFEFISWHFNSDGTGAAAAQRAHELLREQKRRAQREVFWRQAKSLSFEIIGLALAFGLSYTINSVLQRRISRNSS